MKHVWLACALLPACMANAEQSAAAAASACTDVSATCYCTQTLVTDLRCVDCTGTPQFVAQCTPASGGVCCNANDDSACACVSGTSCVSGTETPVAFCTVPAPGGDSGTSGDSDGGDGAICTTTGFCSVGANTCRCGTTCRNYGVSAYVCGFACATDDDCTGRIDPATTLPYARCQPGLQTGEFTYDSYCVP